MNRRELLKWFGGAAMIGAPLVIARKLVKGAMDTETGPLATAERGNRVLEQGLVTSRELTYDGELTPESAWPTYKIAPSTPIAPPGWRLKIGGMVERPLSLTLDELMKMETRTFKLEHHCVEGWSAIAEWTGVPLRELAKRAGARNVDCVEFNSFDIPKQGRPYWSSWDRESALHPETLIAFGMNGKPLSPKHGAPVRLYSPMKLGYKNVKHLTDINFLDALTGGYWENEGYEWFGGV